MCCFANDTRAGLSASRHDLDDLFSGVLFGLLSLPSPAAAALWLGIFISEYFYVFALRSSPLANRPATTPAVVIYFVLRIIAGILKRRNSSQGQAEGHLIDSQLGLLISLDIGHERTRTAQDQYGQRSPDSSATRGRPFDVS